ncbi:MAG: T9SS type A sorting domain-containing protein, partial [Owenweeksia sp.]
IIVKPNARLTLEDGAVLTSGNCNENWSGIWLEGNSQYAQTIGAQPQLILRPGSTIMHAEQAITNSAPPSGNDWIVWGTQGGIIEAEGAVFENNTRDISLVSYDHPSNNGVYKATFKDCQFLRDDNYRNQSLMAHISMLGVEGVKIEGCVFSHEITTPQFKEKGEGIYALNATFKVDNSSTNNSSFTGYRDALRANNVLCALTTNPIEINRTIFNDNHHSIYLSEAQYAKVSHNTLTVPNSAGRTSQNPPAFQPVRYGIYMDGCQDFELYENVLTTNGQNGSIESTGIVLKNTGAVATEVYRNAIDGFTVGMEAIGRNRDAGTTDVGLTFKCNDLGFNYGNAYDVFVAEAASHPENGIQVFQGQNTTQTMPEDLPNNLFTPNGKPFASNFQNDENSNIIYYYGLGGGRFEPRQIIGITTIATQHSVNYINNCPERSLAPPTDLNGPTQGFTQAEGDLATGLSLRNQYIDNGATPALEAQILIADNQQEYQDLYIDLMNMAPYVSEDNLMNLAGINDYPELALRNIMVANPHASRNADIMETLWNKEPPLSQQTLDDIEAGEQTITAKDVLDMQIMDAQQRSEKATREILAFYRSTGEDELNNIIDHLLATDEPHFHYSVVDALIASGDVQTAQSVLNDVPDVCEMSDEAWSDYDEINTFYTIFISLLGSEPVNLDASVKSDLEDIALDDENFAAGRARNLLALYDEPTGYFEPVYIPGVSAKKSDDPNPSRPATAETGFSLSPNPAGTYAILRWNWLQAGLGNNPLTVQITDLKGTLVHKQVVENAQVNLKVLNLDGVSKGAYIVKVLHNKDVVFVSKLLIE